MNTAAKTLCFGQLLVERLSDVSCLAPVSLLCASYLCPFGFEFHRLDLSHANLGTASCQSLAQALRQTPWVTELDLSHNELCCQDVVILFEALPRTHVTRLYLQENFIGASGCAALAAVLPDTQLCYLDVSYNRIGDSGCRALIKALPRAGLTHLSVRGNGIGDAGAQSLAQVLSAYPACLKSLDVRGNKFGVTSHEALVGLLPELWIQHVVDWDDGVSAIRHLCPGTRLEILGRDHRCVSELVRALVKSGGAGEVTALDMVYNEVDAKLATALAQTLLHTSVSVLNLGFNVMGDAGVSALAESLPKTNITSLDLSFNNLGVSGARALADSLPNTNVETLCVASNPCMGENGFWDLVSILPLSRIKKLDVSGIHIGCAGCRDIDVLLGSTSLTNLDMSNNSVGDEGVCDLARALVSNKTITHLDLAANNIGLGLFDLAKILPETKIQTLRLSENRITDQPCAGLGCLARTSLTTLWLDSNFIGSDGCTWLADSLRGTRITTLSLKDNRIGDLGCERLARCLPDTYLCRLYLSKNNIGGVGAGTLAHYLPRSWVFDLEITENPIPPSGVTALAQALSTSRLS